ncbi:Serine/threonine/tyrosine-interacting protein [Madurella mycetomatis]|uniref:Serine/threonine/tyrosine-interacting protein n=1 Tax=Madurella mycetomatis TaxID=100816 RepID=A0A175VTA6_9PEZI|nr:Serine/threonine/tyrosine-interacting protein [Madurella mycetomatis]
MMNRERSPLQPTVLATAPFTTRPPSPPYIHVPTVTHRPNSPGFINSPAATATTTTSSTTAATENNSSSSNNNNNNDNASANRQLSNVLMCITPSPAAIFALPSPADLTPADLAVITSDGRAQAALDPAANAWVYESRRRAQPVLDYLFLGPASAAKDGEFLGREAISMVLAARDARFAVPTGSVGAARARELAAAGVAVESVDVGGPAGGRSLAERGEEEGRVLVCCETGNDRSAAIVAAYLMAIYGLDTVQAVQFVQLQRFCVALGDDVKFLLQAYGDILKARTDVARMAEGGASQTEMEVQMQRAGAEMTAAAAAAAKAQPQFKRRIEEMRMEDGEGDEVMSEMDDERYSSRNFAPFVERDV